MTTIVTRAGKGNPLTYNEMDANFNNLNNDKLEAAALVPYQTITADQADTNKWVTSVAGTNTITGVVTPALTAYTAGNTFRFQPVANNTGAVTININGLGARTITKNGGSALEADDLVAGSTVQITFDGTVFDLMSGTGGGAVGGGVIFINKTTLTSNVTIPVNQGGHMVGPFNTGAFTLTVNGRFVVL